MSTLKSSAENLTLNADGANNDIKFQSNGVEKASIDQDGVIATGGASLDGAVTINDTGADVDFRVESDSVTHALFVDGATGNVGLGDSDPSEAKLSITGVVAGDIGLKIQQDQDEIALKLDQNGNNRAIYIDSESTSHDAIRIQGSKFGLHAIQDISGGYAGTFTRDMAEAGTYPLVRIHDDNTNNTQTTLQVTQDGSGLAADFVGDKIRVADGILFGTDTAAANTLDDYEEGTFTPTIIGQAGASGQSYSTQEGYYTKVGRLVALHGYVTLSTKGTISGNYIALGGFPFANIGNGGFCGSARVEKLEVSSGYIGPDWQFSSGGTLVIAMEHAASGSKSSHRAVGDNYGSPGGGIADDSSFAYSCTYMTS